MQKPLEARSGRMFNLARARREGLRYQLDLQSGGYFRAQRQKIPLSKEVQPPSASEPVSLTPDELNARYFARTVDML